MEYKFLPLAILSAFLVNYFYLYPIINDGLVLATVSILFVTSLIFIGFVYLLDQKHFTQHIEILEQQAKIPDSLKKNCSKQQDLLKEHALKLEQAQTVDLTTNIPNRKQLLKLIRDFNYKTDHIIFLAIRLENLPKLYMLFGYSTIDSLLKEWVRRIQLVLPSDVTIGRLGTNQFTVVYSNGRQSLSKEKIYATCQTLSVFIDAPLYTRQLDLPVYFHHTFGLSISKPGEEDHLPEHYLYSAELAAEEKHKMIQQNVYTSTEQLFHQEQQKMALESHLRMAIEQNQIYVYYQPIVQKQGTKLSYEALARWKHEGVYISPEIFIPMAERAGMISEMTLNIAKKIAADYHKLIEQTGGLYYLSFNLSPSLLAGSEGEYLLDHLMRIFKQHNVPLNQICLEITEEVLLDKEMRTFVNQSRKAGFLIALDDFGTGYSSMSYLVDYDIDIMKLDRSFISQLEHNQKQIDVTKAIITLAQSLEIAIVAEGVERISQSDLLKKLGIEFAQGFYYGKPAPLSGHVNKLTTKSG